MKNVGIWLDKDEAHIVTIENKTESLKTVPSNMEHFRIHGGSGSRQKGGPQDVVQDSKYLEREKHQHKAYFKELVGHLERADNIAIFGPAQTLDRFAKHLKEKHLPLYNKVAAVHKADSMTNNQIIALVRNFFHPK